MKLKWLIDYIVHIIVLALAIPVFMYLFHLGIFEIILGAAIIGLILLIVEIFVDKLTGE